MAQDNKDEPKLEFGSGGPTAPVTRPKMALRRPLRPLRSRSHHKHQPSPRSTTAPSMISHSSSTVGAKVAGGAIRPPEGSGVGRNRPSQSVKRDEGPRFRSGALPCDRESIILAGHRLGRHRPRRKVRVRGRLSYEITGHARQLGYRYWGWMYRWGPGVHS